jgi:hypothetical protein
MDSRLRGKDDKESTSLVKMISSGCFSRVGGNLFLKEKQKFLNSLDGNGILFL